jgi:hypothetical protein
MTTHRTRSAAEWNAYADECAKARHDFLAIIAVVVILTPAVYYFAPYIAVIREWLG